jgi:hypothetical protein
MNSSQRQTDPARLIDKVRKTGTPGIPVFIIFGNRPETTRFVLTITLEKDPHRGPR